jgi:SAM-dependent methyltransferase
MTCRCCHSPDTAPVPFPVPPESGRWVRCRACGSDTADNPYPAGLYSPAYEASEVAATGTPADRRDQVRSNCDWFCDHADRLPARTFLDVGCCDGAALAVMQDRGWAVHGFDVFRPSYHGPHVTVAPAFHRWLFPRRFDAALCREVLEHVESPQFLLAELHGVVVPGGLVQVQTPRPLDRHHPIPYQRQHLALASPARLRQLFRTFLFETLDAREWECGQAYLLRAR